MYEREIVVRSVVDLAAICAASVSVACVSESVLTRVNSLESLRHRGDLW